VLEEVELVIDERAVELPHTIRVTEKIRASVGEIVTRTIWYIVGDLDLFHLSPIHGMGAEIARNRRHEIYLWHDIGRLSIGGRSSFQT
jgi:hypothetical protein